MSSTFSATGSIRNFGSSYVTPRSLANEDEYLLNLLTPRLSRIDAFHHEHAVSDTFCTSPLTQWQIAARSVHSQIQELHHQRADLHLSHGHQSERQRDEIRDRIKEMAGARADLSG